MNKIKVLREVKQMTQDELSEASGVHRVTIARYETTDCGMTVYNAKRIADALGCTVDDLLGDETTPSPSPTASEGTRL